MLRLGPSVQMPRTHPRHLNERARAMSWTVEIGKTWSESGHARDLRLYTRKCL